jgi:hypothetical protein
MLKRLALATTMLAANMFTVTAVQAQEFSGDKRLACEALLCLSSGKRPEQCTPPIQRYFSIWKRKWSDTVNARRDFLNLCPTAEAGSGMPALVNALANGSGRCDADTLNVDLAVTDATYYGISLTQISNTLPAYCTELLSNPYVQMNDQAPVYVGDPANGGFWTTRGNYSTAFAAWQAAHPTPTSLGFGTE